MSANPAAAVFGTRHIGVLLNMPSVDNACCAGLDGGPTESAVLYGAAPCPSITAKCIWPLIPLSCARCSPWRLALSSDGVSSPALLRTACKSSGPCPACPYERPANACHRPVSNRP